jgi:5-azacytidine-induced protein 1
LSLGSIGTAITQEDDDDDDNNDHDGGNGETRRRTQASSSSSSSSAAASFSSPPRAKVRTELTEEAEAASSSSSLSGSFVISPSPKQKRGTPSRLLISPSRLESSQFAAATAATSYPSAAPVTSATSAVEEHVELLPYTETAATSLSDTKQHSTHMPLALASSPSTSANSVSAFLRQLDEMDEHLGFSTESSSAAAPMPSSSSSSSSSPNANKQAARTLSPSTRTATEPKYETSGVVAGATTTSVFDILDALDDAASDLSSLGPAHVSSVSGPAASSSSNSAAAAATIRNEQTRTQTHASQNNDGGRVAATTTATISPPLIPSSSSSSTSSSASSGPLASYASIRTKVVSMSLELEEKTRVIAVLRSQIAQARTVMKARETEAITRSEQMVIEARKDLENRLSQNLTFTERLLSDKARLGSEVEALTKALDAERRRSAEATSEFNERLRREVLLAQEAEREKEKSRRAAWTEATTKEIRARTLKSLEPDVQRLLDKHRIEIEKIQQASADEIERAAKRFAAERDAAIEIAKREAEASGGVQAVESRQAWRAREASLRDEADAQFSLLRDQQRKEIEDERRRSAALSRSVSEEHANEIVKLNNEWQARLDDATRRHADMLASAVREKSEAIVIERKREIAAREAWEVEERHRLRTEFEAREKEARIEAHKLRDEQLRLVASRLDGEALEARRSLKAEMEAVLKKERDEASAHRLALREELDRYRARCEELVRARDDAAASTGNETLRLQKLLDDAKERSVEERAQHRLEYSRMNELQARLQNRVDMLSSELEESRSMNARIEERARDSVSKAMATAGQIEAEQKKRLDAVQRVHEEEVNLIKTRTSIALKRRDELIAQLRLQVEEAKEEADTAKRLMQHARQEILGENASFLQEASPSRSGILRKSRESNE